MILADYSSTYDSGPNLLGILFVFLIPFVIGTFNLVVAIWALVQLNSTRRRITELEMQQRLDAQRAAGQNGQVR